MWEIVGIKHLLCGVARLSQYGRDMISDECVAFTIVMLQVSVNNGRGMISVKCVAFTIVMLYQSMSDHKVIVRNPL